MKYSAIIAYFFSLTNPQNATIGAKYREEILRRATWVFSSLCLMEKSVLSILHETTIIVSVVQLKGVSKQTAAGYRSNRFCQITRKVLQCDCCKLTVHLWRINAFINRE
jgi:hypothetical protein